jgi:hypothetical protein
MPREILFGFGATVPTSILLIAAALFTWQMVMRRHFPEVASAQDELETMVKRVGVSGGFRGNKLIAKPSYRLVVGLVTQLLMSLMCTLFEPSHAPEICSNADSFLFFQIWLLWLHFPPVWRSKERETIRTKPRTRNLSPQTLYRSFLSLVFPLECLHLLLLT